MHERSPSAGFLQAGLAFLACAAILALAGRLWGWPWADLASLHLALVGGASQLVLGAAQTFAAALLATVPPHGRVLAAQRAMWPLGSVLVVVGVAAPNRAVVVVGSTLLAATLVLFTTALGAMQRRALQR